MAKQEALMKELEKYHASDISDALLKLSVPNAGFLCDLTLHSGPTTGTTVALATTVLFAPSHSTDPPCSLPAGTHFADFVTPHRSVVVAQPRGQRCAVVGGLVAERLYQLGARAVVVDGRVRDVAQIGAREDLMLFARGVSAVGAAAESRVVAVDDPVDVSGTMVAAGDIVFAESAAGVVVIPQALLQRVVEMLPRIAEADAQAMEDVRGGKSIYESLRKHRGVDVL